jgi:hypothetical protein
MRKSIAQNISNQANPIHHASLRAVHISSSHTDDYGCDRMMQYVFDDESCITVYIPKYGDTEINWYE